MRRSSERQHRRRRGALLALVTVLGLGCHSPSAEIVVVVESDLSVPAELDAVTLAVRWPTGSRQEGTEALGAEGAPSLPLTLGLTHGGGPLGPLTIEATGARTGESRVSARAVTEFVEGESRVVTLRLTRACVGVSCAETETCADGRCVDAETGTLPRFDAGARDGGRPVEDAGDGGGLRDGGSPVDANFDAGECAADGDCATGFVCPDGRCVACGAAAGTCAPGLPETEPCGDCGTRSRVCMADCVWSAWTACSGEGACTPDQLDSRPCGDCGTQTRTCGADCTWDTWSACGGEGECTSGATESCGTCRTRTCSSSCSWGSCSGCTCSSMTICHTSCPSGYHLAQRICDRSRCAPDNCDLYGYNGYVCEPNCSDSFDVCLLTCPSGYHLSAIECHPSSRCGDCPTGYNGGRCSIDTTTFTTCASGCPSGYTYTSSTCDSDCGSCAGGNNAIVCTRS